MVKRIITAILGLPIIIALLIFADKYIFSVVATIVAMITLREYFNAFKKDTKPIEWIGYIACLLITIIHFIPDEYMKYILALSIPTICAVLFMQVVVTNMKTTMKDAIITLFGIIYVVGFLIFLPLIFGMENGKLLIWYVFISAWGNDMCAYFIGVNLGKHKVTPISPKKSLEGCIGGVLGAIIMAEIGTYIFNTFFTLAIF